MRNSEWPLASCGGSVSTMSTGVAFAPRGGVIVRVIVGQRRLGQRRLGGELDGEEIFDRSVLDAAVAAVVEHRAHHERLRSGLAGRRRRARRRARPA